MIDKSEISLILDINNPNMIINQRFLQGNNLVTFKIQIAKNGKLQTLADNIKPTIKWIYEDNEGYMLSPELSNGKGANPNYNVTVLNNIITIPANVAITDHSGNTMMVIEIPDESGIVYAYSYIYNVDKNPVYTATIHSNIDDTTKFTDEQFFAKGIRSGLADASKVLSTDALKPYLTKDLADIDVDKLDEKFQVTDSGKELKIQGTALNNKANLDMSNIAPATFNRELVQNKAFQDLQNHPNVVGKTDAEIKALFYANRYEEQASVDLTQPPFNTPTTLLMVYQINSEGKLIKQVLPPSSTNQIIMVEMIYSKGVTTGTLEIDVPDGEHLEGVLGQANSLTFDEKGYLGYFLPLQNASGYEFISHHETAPYSLTLSDEKGSIVLDSKAMKFNSPLYIEHNDSTGETQVKFEGQGIVANLPFVDGQTGAEFTPTKVQSLDKSIRIAKLGEVADLSIASTPMSEGIMATLGSDELFSSANENKDFFFKDVKHQGGTYVYANRQNNSYVLQEIDSKDPLVTGGTEFLLGIAYFPNELNPNAITQDGYFRIEFVDSNGDIFTDINGNPMATEIHYKAGQMERKQLYLGLTKVKNYTEIKVRFASNFANEEMISIGSNSAILIQPISPEHSSGLAVLNFIAYTGYNINLNSIHYGKNNIDLSKVLQVDNAEQELLPKTNYLGDNLYFDSNSKLKIAIQNNHLIIKDNGKNLPIFSIYKLYNRFDSTNLRYQSASANISVVANIPHSSLSVALLKYTGLDNNIPSPSVLSYLNSQPQFNAGWTKVDSMEISSNVDGLDKETTKIFDFPLEETIKAFAFVLYATDSVIPMEMQIKDFKADITPDFTRVIITDNSHIEEQTLLARKDFYKSIVDCPSFLESYRYTSNMVDTKVPIGTIKSKGNLIINNNAWTDVGSSDPHKAQGDFQFKADGKVNFEYGAQIYNDSSTINNVEFWLAKVNGDGTFTEVPNSRYASTIEANRINTPKNIISNSFDFEVKENESYRMFMKSNVDDGFYLECTPNGNPMYYASIVFDEYTVKDKDIMEQSNEVMFMENGKEVFNKMLQYDITTGKMTVVDKK